MQEIEVKYNCKNLLEESFNKKYYTDINIQILSEDKIVLKMQYLLICNPEMMQTFDLNMPILFIFAVFIVFFSFNSPELQMILDMTA